MKELTQQQRRTIEYVIIQYPEWKEEYQDAYERILTGTPVNDGQPRSKTYGSSRQERLAEKMESKHFSYIKQNLDAVESTLCKMDPDKQKVIRLRYWTGTDKKLPILTISQKCYVSEATVKRIITAYLAILGREIGLLA